MLTVEVVRRALARHDPHRVVERDGVSRAAVAAIIRATKQRSGGAVGALSIHSVMMGTFHRSFHGSFNSIDMATADGQGVRWALNLIHKAGLRDRVYGPDLMLKTCRAASEAGIGVYLHGSTTFVLERLQANLQHQFPQLLVVGAWSPPFRTLTRDEDTEAISRIDESGAGIVCVGLGCPRQEVWIAEHRHRMKQVLISVGAAFDFIAGTKRQAPQWMRKCGLEMAFRACIEPRRLMGRFILYSPSFVFLVFLQWIRLLFRPDVNKELPDE